jgi:hypothetical protein
MQQSTELSGTPGRPEELSSSGENTRVTQPHQSIARNKDTMANSRHHGDENANEHDTQGGREQREPQCPLDEGALSDTKTQCTYFQFPT